jgi:uncharacterized protein (DUF1800 family)
MSNPSLQAAIAAHRFGLGEASLDAVQPDPQAWLLGQIGPADTPHGDGLLNTHAALEHVAAEKERRQLAKNPPPGMSLPGRPKGEYRSAQHEGTPVTAEQVLAGHYREVTLADARSRFATAVATRRPFAERLQLFWANHFTVSLAKGSARGLVGAFERDAIRPNIAGSFETLLVASTTHPAMLRYLDNNQSAGPNSRVVARAARRASRNDETARITGLNENLAREVLELHTLGVTGGGAAYGGWGGYTQADVTAFARVLTGWRVGLQATDAAQAFDPNWHEPGRKTVLGKAYAEGPDALRQLLHDLARHPSTAHFIATKLARHFVADAPPPALVERLAAAYQRSDGQLAEVYRALVRSPEAWDAQAAKLKTPEEFVVSTVRVLGSGKRTLARGDGPALQALGQRIHAAPSPAGWSDIAADWLGPDAVWKRVEWATRVADRVGGSIDARSLAERSFGPWLSDTTRQQIERAADGPQALALLLMAPEFQRR